MIMKEDERKTVVMVDDDRDFQTIVRGWLAAECDVVSLFSGEGILEELAQIGPDLVILDICMPGPDGIKLCAAIRADRKFSELPILFLTGCRDDEHFIDNLNVGGTAYLTKPVEKKKLLATVRELIGAGQWAR